MSTPEAGEEHGDHEGGAGDEGEGEDEFYESLDRILSTVSNEDADHASYELWTSEPASIHERRQRLLQQMGLAADPTLSRRPHPNPDHLNLTHKPNPTPTYIESPPLPPDNPTAEEKRRYTIRNLDTGREFVLKDEDGKDGELREVDTRRQLTMEEFSVGTSPIVQELMRRQTQQDPAATSHGSTCSGSSITAAVPAKKRRGWLRSLRNVAGSVVSTGRGDRCSSDERETSSEKGGWRSSSATDDSQDGFHSLHHGPEKVKVRHYGKSHKELTGLYLCQEIQAHTGSIWCIKFSLDGKLLASAGEDRIIHVWKVLEFEWKEKLFLDKEIAESGNYKPLLARISNGLQELAVATSSSVESSEKKTRVKIPSSGRSASFDHLMVPEIMFALSDKPVVSFKGHLADVLDISWSKSLYLLSSSMDKTVRLWNMTSDYCLKTFAHSDYVTCIQFNPVDDKYFISGSLDEKVRIWSVPDRQVVDWIDLHEMVTAACYTPDGQGALIGSHKGSCHLYDTSENKLQQKNQIDLWNKKKRSSHKKKITGFQFIPGSSSEVLITSADSRIRVIDGIDLVHKFKGFRNTSSQISASLTANGMYVICASEDSRVYLWRYDDSRPSRSKELVSATKAYEHFYCQDVSVAAPWPSLGARVRTNTAKQEDGTDGICQAKRGAITESGDQDCSLLPPHGCASTQLGKDLIGCTGHSSDRASATWPEEKLLYSNKINLQFEDERNLTMPAQSWSSAWEMVIVTAGRGGEVKVFQNFGFPVRI